MKHEDHRPSSEKSLGERNEEHFDKYAEAAFKIPWIIELSKRITEELQQNSDWIGITHSRGDETFGTKKMLDYACGDGLASHALGSYFTTIRGMDISSAMVSVYNKKAQDDGFSVERRCAIQGDLLNPEGSSSPELCSPDLFEFDLVVMCMALHHVEDYTKMIQKLAARLKEGGVLVIVDWVAPTESGCLLGEKAKELSNHTIARLGMAENELKTAYDDAGLENWAWRWATERSKLPEEIGGEQQLFLARGQKPKNF